MTPGLGPGIKCAEYAACGGGGSLELLVLGLTIAIVFVGGGHLYQQAKAWRSAE